MPSLTWSDKTYHFLAYAGLAFLLGWTLQFKSRLRHALAVLSIAAIYAFTDEALQNLIPGRTFDWWDMVADWMGAGSGMAAYLVCRLLLLRVDAGRKLIRSLSGSIHIFGR